MRLAEKRCKILLLKNYFHEIQKLVGTYIPEGRILRIIALQTGANEVMLTYKIHPGKVSDVAALINAINTIEENVKKKFSEVKWQFIEPDFVE